MPPTWGRETFKDGVCEDDDCEERPDSEREDAAPRDAGSGRDPAVCGPASDEEAGSGERSEDDCGCAHANGAKIDCTCEYERESDEQDCRHRLIVQCEFSDEYADRCRDGWGWVE
ncbi:hypothetical protein GCM10009021_24700 [Halarchaeum nitratireducens]|uniref:Uncharacterized protein n=1 Tax=Halarchaeum nitratireducens TaxID=489913 RepID=A0A830GDY5_9EURY|nr:hypothetical protein GCM10009021_24700 [Halarchaeum nitratireducens]